MKSFGQSPDRRQKGYRIISTEYAISSAWRSSFPWIEGQDDRHRIDALRLLQQMPAIVSIALVDQTGTERVFASRLSLNRIGRGADMSEDPAVVGARDSKVWYGPVRYHHDIARDRKSTRLNSSHT